MRHKILSRAAYKLRLLSQVCCVSAIDQDGFHQDTTATGTVTAERYVLCFSVII